MGTLIEVIPTLRRKIQILLITTGGLLVVLLLPRGSYTFIEPLSTLTLGKFIRTLFSMIFTFPQLQVHSFIATCITV